MIRKRLLLGLHRPALLVPLLVPLVVQSRWVCLAFSTSTTTKASHHPLAKSNKEPIRLETKSCVPPRFDVFGESLVGRWAIDGETMSQVTVAAVEEVMRSCGGAVQGIREPETGKHKGDETTTSSSTTYLNRANDGFVFFDDGSYTMGPVSLQSFDRSNGFLSCLVLPEKDSGGRMQRVVMDFGLAAAAATAEKDQHDGSYFLQHHNTSTMRTQQRFGDETVVSSGMGEHSFDNDLVEIEEITRILRCRMPSEGQPWMLQRVKWETLVVMLPYTKDGEPQNTEVDNSGIGESPNKESNPICWSISEPVLEFYERLGLSMAGEGTMVHSGLACPKTNTLRLLARQYQNKNSSSGGDNLTLCGILFIEGKVKFRGP